MTRPTRLIGAWSLGCGLVSASFADVAIHAMERQLQEAGVPLRDIAFSKRSGMDARDIQVLREYSQRRATLIVLRCPPVTARLWHGTMPAKPQAVKGKSDAHGIATQDYTRMSNENIKGGLEKRPLVALTGRLFVSDYDLMSVWKQSQGGWQKIFISASGGRDRGAYPAEGMNFLREINRSLVSKFQHGCQDDWQSGNNTRGVKGGDRFAAFARGQSLFLEGPHACETFYRSESLSWVYDKSGSFITTGFRSK